MELSHGAETILNKLQDAGFEAYVVGGAVRNCVLGLPVGDYDITTSATPERILEVFRDFRNFTPGIKHGTVCVVADGENFEITTYRTDGSYSDNRHPDSVRFSDDLSEDLSRRDFTVNAMCFNGRGIVDLFGGIDDCKAKVIRCIGDPVLRFREDALRIMRALRFASALGFSVEKNTKAALFAQKSLLLNISAERLRTEFLGVLCGVNAENVLLEYREIFAVVIPEIAPSFDFDQRTPYHCFDVYVHSVKATAHVKNTPNLRLAAFLHDVGKPHSFTVDDEGRGHFFGHQKVSRDIADVVLHRLKCPKTQINEVLTLIENHDYPIVPNGFTGNADKYLLRALNKFGEAALRDLIELKRADNFAKAEWLADRIDALDGIEHRLDELIRKKACFSLKDLAVDGNDVIALGITGKAVGEVLDFLLGEVLAERLPNEKAALVCAAEKFINSN